jgi:4-hydroxy-tetrahydrodipicolinate synthase
MIKPGSYAATLTPMCSDFRIQMDDLALHCFELIKKGCTGIALFGTTGEGASFSTREKTETIKNLVKRGFAVDKIIFCNGSATLVETVELIQQAYLLGCSPFLIALSCFLNPLRRRVLLNTIKSASKKLIPIL